MMPYIVRIAKQWSNLWASVSGKIHFDPDNIYDIIPYIYIRVKNFGYGILLAEYFEAVYLWF